jgi:glycosyltransferase involved in cell wall biosynthesis
MNERRTPSSELPIADALSLDATAVEPQGSDSIVLPILARPLLLGDGGRLLISGASEQQIDPRFASVVDAILYEAPDLEALVSRICRTEPNSDPREVASRLLDASSKPDNVLRLVSVRAPRPLDAVMVCQGYGGLYMHSVQLWERLNRDRNVMLFAPVEPPYGYDKALDDRLFVFERVREKAGLPAYAAYMQIVRGFVANANYDLLYLEHRSQSLYLFDLLEKSRRPSIIHDDGFYDGVYFGAASARRRLGARLKRTILSEIFATAQHNAPTYFGLMGNPLNNRLLMEAGWFALRSATENWCWSKPHFEQMSSIYAQTRTRTRFRFVPPLVDTGLRRKDIAYNSRRVLFSTTMHNIERKGIVELCRALRFVPDSIRAVCVLGQPDRLPRGVKAMRKRLILRPKQSKARLVELYHRSALYCRVSREESSPLSILEAMACGTPIITSPTVAENLPILEDGVTGFLVEPGASPQVLAERITRICDDRALRRRMSLECVRRAQQFGLDRNLGLLTRHFRHERSP